jgi:hypothetical protein
MTKNLSSGQSDVLSDFSSPVYDERSREGDMRKAAIFYSLALAGLSACFCPDLVPNVNSTSGGNQTGPFAGTWVVLVSTTVNCPGQAPSADTETEFVTFTINSSTSIDYQSVDGCTFDFSVNGNLATLSDGPVACETDAGVVTFTSYTVTAFPDAGAITTSSSANLVVGDAGCTATSTGSGEQ